MNKDFAPPMIQNQSTLLASKTSPDADVDVCSVVDPLALLSDRTYGDALRHGLTTTTGEYPHRPLPTIATGGMGVGVGGINTGGLDDIGHGLSIEEEQLQMAIRLSMEINQPPPPPPAGGLEGGGDSKGSTNGNAGGGMARR